MKRQFGQSMIEMLGVLAIIGVLSIGGIALYRRAVNNHQANTILDDVNRFAFAIIEKGSYPLGRVIPKGDFKESGIYTLEGYQDAEANQFSITVADVPKGVCEPLLDKATVEYKVRINQSANELGPLYDSLNTDLCRDNNIMVFYFGDTAGVCNVPDDDGPTQCTVNSDCCGGEFCAFQDPVSNTDKGDGICMSIDTFGIETKTITVNGLSQTWTASWKSYDNKRLTWDGANNWCAAQGKQMASIADFKCDVEIVPGQPYCTSNTIAVFSKEWDNSYFFLKDKQYDKYTFVHFMISSPSYIGAGVTKTTRGNALCR